ncbi:CaMBD domain-containing protein [Aphelenchoides fujianensis]|nr:CaMBD domain-containing protein [Aphelenchoides fujianensis]
MAAAARLGAFGLADKSRGIQFYSSTPLRSFRDDEEDEERTPLNQRTAANGVQSKQLPRSSKGYGISLMSKQTIHERFKQRRLMVQRRVKLCDWSVGVALAGLALGILDVELSLSWGRGQEIGAVSTFLRIAILLSTLLLDTLIVLHHFTELAIISADTGHEAMCMPRRRRVKLFIELLICSCCPIAGTTTIEWPILSEGAFYGSKAFVPLNVLLIIPMFARLYLLCRFMVLHSDLIQDAGIRTVASLNQIPVDFAFVLKTLLGDRPLTLVLTFSLTFWASASWMMTTCERFVGDRDPYLPTTHFLFDYAWFEAVTFFAIGFGDIRAESYCGRVIAISTGIVGTIFSSLITVLLSQRMLLSLAERRVNQVIAESKLQQQHKHAAAKVLQSTWRTVRLQKRLDGCHHGVSLKKMMLQLRLAQRTLLQSILEFRKIRWKLRLRIEEEDDIITIRRAFAETEDRLHHLRHRQQQLGFHLQGLTSRVDRIAAVIVARYRQNGNAK